MIAKLQIRKYGEYSSFTVVKMIFLNEQYMFHLSTPDKMSIVAGVWMLDVECWMLKVGGGKKLKEREWSGTVKEEFLHFAENRTEPDQTSFSVFC